MMMWLIGLLVSLLVLQLVLFGLLIKQEQKRKRNQEYNRDIGKRMEILKQLQQECSEREVPFVNVFEPNFGQLEVQP